MKFLWVHATHATSHLGFRRLFSHRDMQSWKAVCDHALCFRYAGQMERQRSCHQSILVCRIFGTGAIRGMLIFVGLASSVCLCKLDLVTSKGFWKLWGSQLGLQAYRLQTLRNCLIENHPFVVCRVLVESTAAAALDGHLDADSRLGTPMPCQLPLQHPRDGICPWRWCLVVARLDDEMQKLVI